MPVAIPCTTRAVYSQPVESAAAKQAIAAASMSSAVMMTGLRPR